jgi:predicted SAM-dependent methyltransferase
MGKQKQKQSSQSVPAVGLSLVSPSPPLVEAPAPVLRKLDLGCGQNPKEGFEGVDLYGDKAKHRVDLFKFPWPFEDSSVDEIHCSHFLEHVPAREVETRDLIPFTKGSDLFVGADMLFVFMDECWRILKPESWMTAIVPSGRSNRAYQDPTHRRFFMQETFLYFSRDWRKMNGLDHYRVRCNFGCDVPYSLPQEEGLRAAEVQQQRFQTLWNVTIDWHAKLKKLP